MPNKKTFSYDWILKLVPAGGSLAGLIMALIGGTMLLNTTLKLYVFNFDTSPYFNAEEICDGDLRGAPMKEMTESQETLTPEEKEAKKQTCIEKRRVLEKKRYIRRQQETLIDGFVFFLVGAPLFLLFWRKVRKLS